MSDLVCSTAAGAQQDGCCGYAGGSTLGWGPIGPTQAAWNDWASNGGAFTASAWTGPIGIAGWSWFDPECLPRNINSLVAKWPRGWAWDAAEDPTTLMGQLTLAFAELSYDVQARACDLRKEFYCYSMSETRDLWALDYGIPDDCGIDDICAKVAATGGASCTYLTDLAAILGYTLCCNELPIEVQTGFWNLGCDQLAPAPNFTGGGCDLGVMQLGQCGDTAFVDDAITCKEWSAPTSDFVCGGRSSVALDYTGTAYVLQTGIPATSGGSISPLYAVTGSWSLGIGELCTPPDNAVLCFINRFRPAHVRPITAIC